MPLKQLILKGEEALKITQALSSETVFNILRLTAKEPLDISTIARRLNVSEAYISEGVRMLEKLGLIHVSYAPGKRGIRKICELAVEKVTIIIKA
jgi:predicted transcriptional regulator